MEEVVDDIFHSEPRTIPFDLHVNIFQRLEPEDLGICKSVCKSWKSFISGSRFIEAHLDLSYKSNENEYKRIGKAVFLEPISTHRYFIGSSNGLVCIIYDSELLVANPSTREVKLVPNPSPHVKSFPDLNAHNKYDDSRWGFGYDSLRDDYKVVCGVMKGGGQTCFHVFSLRSNKWRVIEEVNYTHVPGNSGVGVLCNGAMHWLMYPKNQETKIVILSFDLSEEKEIFKEIPQPDDAEYISLGIMEECLCLYYYPKQFRVMKKYNDKRSWEEVKFERIMEKPSFNPVDFRVTNKTFTGGISFKSKIVKSLVSPHLYREEPCISSSST